MKEMTFVDRVKRHFGYLESKYSFRLTFETYSDVRPHSDGEVNYTSDSVVVVVDSEAGSAAVWFYRIKDGRTHDLDPVSIHEFISTSDKEKQILLSINPEDQAVVSSVFNQKFLLNQSGWISDGSPLENLEVRLGNYANWLAEHAELCLIGDLSHWPKFYEYKIQRARADHLRRGNSEFGYARVKDSSGNWTLIKQSIFKDKLEYLEKLKQEFSK